MLEMMMISRMRLPLTDALIDIDFANAPLGSRVIPDRGKLQNVWTRGLIAGVAQQDGVVDLPNGLGRGYYFDANTYFMGNKIPPMYNGRWKLTARVVPLGGGSVLSTGNFPSSGGIRAGFNFAGGQYATQYWQYFQTTGGGSFQRTLLDGAKVDNVIDVLTVTRDATTIIRNERTGKQNSYANFNTGGDSYVAIASCQSFTTAFSGYLLSLKLELLP